MHAGEYHPYTADLDIIEFCRKRGWPVLTHPFFADMPKYWPFVVCELRDASVLGDYFLPVCDNEILSDCLSFFGPKHLAKLRQKQGSGERRVLSVDKAFLLGGDDSFGMVISTVLMRALYLKMFPQLAELPVITKAGMRPVLYEMFHVFGIAPDRLIPLEGNDAIECGTLYMPTIAGGVSPELNKWWIPAKLTQLYRQLILATYQAPAVPNPAGRVYIARRNTPRKLIKNEDAVMEFMQARGYEVFDPGAMTLRDQVHLAQKTRYFVSCEGSQVHLSDYAQAGAKVIMLCGNDFMQQRSVGTLDRWADLGIDIVPYLSSADADNFLDVDLAALEQTMRGLGFPTDPV